MATGGVPDSPLHRALAEVLSHFSALPPGTPKIAVAMRSQALQLAMISAVACNVNNINVTTETEMWQDVSMAHRDVIANGLVTKLRDLRQRSQPFRGRCLQAGQ